MIKKFLLCLLFVLLFLNYGGFCNAKKATLPNLSEVELAELNKMLKPEDYKKIYNNLPILDIMYINDEDPFETYEYNRAMVNSPYPLIRIPVTLNCKMIKLLPGEYLLKASNYNSYDFIMFKQKGKIIGLVPVYEKHFVGKLIVKKKKAKLQYTKSQRRWSKVKKIVKFPVKRILNPPESENFALDDYYTTAREYLVMNFYYKDTLYKIIFAVEKPER